jgi:hypothetical protein
MHGSPYETPASAYLGVLFRPTLAVFHAKRGESLKGQSGLHCWF